MLFTSDGAPNGVGSLKFKFSGLVPFLNMLGVIGFFSLWLPVVLVCEPVLGETERNGEKRLDATVGNRNHRAS